MLGGPPRPAGDPDVAHRRLGYVRFHEGTADPWPGYGDRALGSWAETLARTWPSGAPVYAYFNNDQNAAAVADAATLARLATAT